MSDKKSIDTEKPVTIEQHRKTRGTRSSVYAGAMTMAGWSTGKMVNAAEYDAAVRAFLSAGTGGEADEGR